MKLFKLIATTYRRITWALEARRTRRDLRRILENRVRYWPRPYLP